MGTENKKAQVFVQPGAIVCSVGKSINELWQALVKGSQNLTELPCPAYEGWPWSKVFLVEEPNATDLGVDRKILRTMEKQSKLALYGALLAVRQNECITDISIDSEQKGLYLALPTVDESVPPWSLLETLQEVSNNPAQPNELFSSEFLLREIPAFFGLSTLNSNACAHISACFNLTGAMGAYSPFADAAFQAVIDGTNSIAQGENSVALVGSVSPKINPQLLLQYEYWGWDKSLERIPAEATGFVILTKKESPGAIRVSGAGRGFIVDQKDKSKTYQQVFAQALKSADIHAEEIDWFLPYATNREDASILFNLGAKKSLPILASEICIGFSGAAGPMINFNLALFGLHQQKVLRNVQTVTGLQAFEKSELREIKGAMRHVALSAEGPEGQYVVIILSRETV